MRGRKTPEKTLLTSWEIITIIWEIITIILEEQNGGMNVCEKSSPVESFYDNAVFLFFDFCMG